MKQTFDFERFAPPVLNENILRRELEKRAERRHTVLLDQYLHHQQATHSSS